jgi:AraC-like DNA-binding protein
MGKRSYLARCCKDFAYSGKDEKRMHEKHPATISVDMLRLVARYAAMVEIDEIIIPVEGDILESSDGWVSLDQFATLWESIIQQSTDPYFGLHFGEAASALSSGHVVFTLMMNSPTVGHALERFCRYHRLLTDAVQPETQNEGSRLIFRWKQSVMPDRHYAEAILSMLSTLLARLAEQPVRPVEVRFVAERPVDIQEYQRIFSVQPLFAQSDNRLTIEHQEQRIFLANPELLAAVEPFGQRALAQASSQHQWTYQVSDIINQLLMSGEPPQLQKVSHRLGISSRHLANKLHQERTSFQETLDSVRKLIALEYLKQGTMTMCELAFLLGFSEQSAFNHAFKRWTGMAPGAYLARSH